MGDAGSPRARQIVATARALLEREGRAALTMRRLADELGIRAPSLYKHLPDKRALEAAIITTGFEEAATCFEQAEREAERDAGREAGDPLAAFIAAYRAFARRHPHVYRLMTDGPLPRDAMREGLEARTAAPLLRAVGDPERARAVFGFVHGMVLLELDVRLPADDLTERAWASGIAALRR